MGIINFSYISLFLLPYGLTVEILFEIPCIDYKILKKFTIKVNASSEESTLRP